MLKIIDKSLCPSMEVKTLISKLAIDFLKLIKLSTEKNLPWVLFFYFYWSIIALQYCVGFCCTTKWISNTYTYIPSLLNLPSISYHPTTLSHHRAVSWAQVLFLTMKSWKLLLKKTIIYFNWRIIFLQYYGAWKLLLCDWKQITLPVITPSIHHCTRGLTVQ